jgi:hypothetical protein
MKNFILDTRLGESLKIFNNMRFLQLILICSILYGIYSIITADLSGFIWLLGGASFLFLSNKWMN